MFRIPKDIKAKPRLLGLEIKELIFFSLGIVLIFTVLADLVHQIFKIPYYIVSVGLLFYAIMPSQHNTNRKKYHSFFYLFKRDKQTYSAIDTNALINRELEKELKEFYENHDWEISDDTLEKYASDIEYAKRKQKEREREFMHNNEDKNVEKNEQQSDESEKIYMKGANEENTSVKDKIVSSLDKFKKHPKLTTVIALVIAVAIISFSINGTGDTLADTEESESETKQEMFLKEGLLSASVKDYDEASVYLDKVDYDNLNDEEKNVVLNIYLYANEPEKAVSLEQGFDERVIEYYKNIDDTEKIQELSNNENFDTSEFKFEMAVQNEEDEDVIALQNEVAKNEYKEDKIVNAYINKEEFDKAEQFIANNSLPNKYTERVNNAKEDAED